MSTRVLTKFDLQIPQDIPEALAILDEYQEKITPVAGGSDMLIAWKHGVESGNAMSVTALPGLDYLTYDENEGLRIGALATIDQLLRSDIVREKYPALWESAEIFATHQIKNTATLVGNCLRASPAGDGSAAAYALGATLTFVSKDGGERKEHIDDLFTGYAQTSRKPNELATEISIPAPKVGSRSAFIRVTRVNEDLAKLNVAAYLKMDGDTCSEARLVMGCVGPTLLRLPKCEALLKGSKVDDATLDAVANTVNDEISPIDDQRSTAEYRRSVAPVFLKRTILKALS
ncbi:MAG: FAD binding domain-containing protein [Halioglobus sp.]